MHLYLKWVILSAVLCTPFHALAQNTSIESFSKAKRLLLSQVYSDHKETIYCSASFNDDKTVELPSGFVTSTHKKRSKKVEWEHVVPAENFGKTFSEWREGHSDCVNSKGKSFKGRNCASKMNVEYRLMQADMYNLFPAIGAVNAKRSNYNFTLLPPESSDFGSCKMKVEERKAEPPEEARGRIARTYLYMEATYPRYKMSKQQRQLMEAWDKTHPVSAWECIRYKRIKDIQGSENPVLAKACNSKEF